MSQSELFRFARITMTLAGIWKLDLPVPFEWISQVYPIYSVVVHIVYASLPLLLTMNFPYLLENDPIEATESLSKILYCVPLIVKLFSFQSENSKYLIIGANAEEARLYQNADNFVKSIHEMHVLYCNRLNKLILMSVAFAGFLLCELGIVDSYKFHKLVKNESKIMVKPLPLPFWYPFNENKYHVWVLTEQLLTIVWCAISIVSVHTFSNSVFIYTRGQLKILQSHFSNFHKNIVDGGNGVVGLKELCVKHQNLIAFARITMTLTGIWKLELSYPFKRFTDIYKTYSVLVHLIYISVPLLMTLNIPYLLQNNPSEAPETLSKTLYCILLLVKLFSYQSENSKFLLTEAIVEEAQLYQYADSFTKVIYEKHVLFCNRLNRFILISVALSGALLWEIGIVDSYKFHKLLKNESQALVKPLPLKCWYPFDENKYHVWVLIEQLLTYLNIANQTLKTVVFLEYGISSIMLATALLQVIAGKNVITNVVHVSVIISQLLLLAWSSDEIVTQSLQLAPALYQSKWYECDRESRILIRIMLMRCQKPLSIDIGSFGPMTVRSAMSRLKLAYSYTSVMTN